MATPDFKTQEAIRFLSDFFYNLSQTRMAKHCPSDFTFTTSEFEEHTKCEVMGEDNSIILLWGEAGAMVFKVHYDIEIVAPYAAAALMKPLAEISRDTARAYMNEYLNLYAGYFRGITEEKKLVFGMSLPFHTRGMDELIFFKLRDQRFKFYKWKMNDQNGKCFYCTCEIMPLDHIAFLNLKDALLKDLENDKSSDIDGEIQFF